MLSHLWPAVGQLIDSLLDCLFITQTLQNYAKCLYLHAGNLLEVSARHQISVSNETNCILSNGWNHVRCCECRFATDQFFG